jgi:hypothetical protein
MGGLRLIKTVWVVTLCLAALGGSYAGKVAASIPPIEEAITGSTKVSSGFAQDTLAPSDKFGVAHYLPAQTLPTPLTESIAAANGQMLEEFRFRPTGCKAPKTRSEIRLSENNIR